MFSHVFRDQFPTERLCLLEEAINLCQSPERVDNSSISSLSSVGSSLATYKAAQKEISSCKDQVGYRTGNVNLDAIT